MYIQVSNLVAVAIVEDRDTEAMPTAANRLQVTTAAVESLRRCPICFAGRHGSHLLSTEPENKPACAGARSSLQSSPETQYEETHLDRHVGTRTRSPSISDLALRRTVVRKKRRRKKKQNETETNVARARTRRAKSWPVPLPVSPFNLFICHTSTYARGKGSARTGRQPRSRDAPRPLWGQTALCLFLQLSLCTRPPRLSFALPHDGKKRTS